MNLSASLFFGRSTHHLKIIMIFCSYFLEKSYSSSSSSRWKILYKDWCRKNCITKMFFFSFCKIFKCQSLYLVSSRGEEDVTFFQAKIFCYNPKTFSFDLFFVLILWPFSSIKIRKAQIKKKWLWAKTFLTKSRSQSQREEELEAHSWWL